MRPDRKNLDKIKDLCQELDARDAQIKINASTLWDVAAKIQAVRDLLDTECDKMTSDEKINQALTLIDEASAEIVGRGCRKVIENAGK